MAPVVDVVIFGTGSNSERAWRAAAGRPDVRVVCAADNDVRKQGTRWHGLRVVAPDTLLGESWDFIVVASMFAPEICRQLEAGGIDQARIVAPGAGRFSEAFSGLAARMRADQPVAISGDAAILARDLPEILIVTCETLDSTHGTGVLLQRFFADFPHDKLFSVCHRQTGQPWLPQALTLAPSSRPEAVHRALASAAFAPRLVYATAFNETDLQLLETVLAALPPGTPVVQHFMDYMPHDPEVFDRRFRAMGHRFTEVWALADGMARELSERLDRRVAVVSALHQDAPALVRRRTAPAGHAAPRTVMLGNVWQPEMLGVVQRVWRRCQAALPGLGGIEWYVHPTRVQASVEAGYVMTDAVQWRGFLTGTALQERLQAADLAIVPFNADSRAGSGYARFSLPSRLTELCGAGLPVAVLASPDTEPARFVRDRECGIVVTGPDEEAMAAALLRLIADPGHRLALGARARDVAERELALGPFQRELVGRFVSLAGRFTAPEDWRGPRSSNLVPLQAGDGAASPVTAPDVLGTRVHYACGRNVLPGWVNVDGLDESYPAGEVPPALAGAIVRADLTRRHPFPDDHFVLGYSEDFVEHIDQADLASFLCEAYRTFRAGGVLRLSTPGLHGILRRHLRGADWRAAGVLRDEAYTAWWHKHFVCFEELDVLARHIGWREVRGCRYGESSVPGLALESRPAQADLNLVVELIK